MGQRKRRTVAVIIVRGDGFGAAPEVRYQMRERRLLRTDQQQRKEQGK
jgi:hypothetical protein